MLKIKRPNAKRIFRYRKVQIEPYDIYIWIIGVILVIISSTRPLHSTDTYSYYNLYRLSQHGIPENSIENTYIFASKIAYALCGNILGFRLVLFFYASFAMIIVIISIKRSKDRIISILIWFSFAYAFQMLIQIRAAIANFIFMWSLQDIIEGNYKKYYIKVLIAYLFHNQAIALVFIYPVARLLLKKREILVSLLPIFILVAHKIPRFMGRIISFVSSFSDTLAYKLEFYTTHAIYSQQKMNPINRISIVIVAIIIYEFFIVGVKKLKDDEVVYLFVLSTSIFCYFIGYFAFPPIAMRYPECLNLALVYLFPVIGRRHFKNDKRYLALILCYLLVINYQYSTFRNIFSYVFNLI